VENPILDFLYLICIILFIVGLKRLSSPDTAKKGNMIAAIGMGAAILITMFYPMEGSSNNYIWIFGGLVIGGVIGFVAAKRVKMTKMPEMVSLFNGLGGACSMLIAAVEFVNLPEGTPMLSSQVLIIIFALFVGSIAFTGSIVAWGKLDGFLRDSLVLPYPQIINVVMLLAVLGLSGYIMMQPEVNVSLVMILLGLSMVYGVTFVTPIGGRDKSI
jgi:NAD(P) transhydrogenase subunit beta